MRSLEAVTLLFIVVVIINSVVVYAQHRFKVYTRLFGRYDWGVHTILLTIIWVGFLFAIIIFQPPNWPLPSALRLLSIIAATAGIWLVVESWIKLGTAGVCNGRSFGRGPTKLLTDGIFRLRNPMYTGFVLLFVSAGFWLENAAYLWLAFCSFVLLNLFQARIERQPSKYLAMKN
jgi:protein-S-isoprenylcysteine O-methyltransferase Ste14